MKQDFFDFCSFRIFRLWEVYVCVPVVVVLFALSSQTHIQSQRLLDMFRSIMGNHCSAPRRKGKQDVSNGDSSYVNCVAYIRSALSVLCSKNMFGIMMETHVSLIDTSLRRRLTIHTLRFLSFFSLSFLSLSFSFRNAKAKGNRMTLMPLQIIHRYVMPLFPR